MIPDIDWPQAWREAQKLRPPAGNAESWDKAAPKFAQTERTSPYAAAFIERLGLQEGETVFDMGCGAGILALPLARAGHEVHAADFSQGMMDIMMQSAADEGVDGLIHPHLLAWDDDWTDIDVPICDIAIASRSLATADMMSALEKLASMARRKVCLALATADSPRHDGVLMQVMGRKRVCVPDFVFALNMLWAAGIRAELSFICTHPKSEFSSFEEAIDTMCELHKATAEERASIESYSREHLRPATSSDGKEVWCYDHERVISWAFVSWEV